MANRFWVGGGSANTWAATANTNWATTSGGANNASVPGVSDVAIFDSNSGSGNSVIGANITVQGLDCTGGTGNYAGTITHNTGVTLTINTGAATSIRFSAGMTYTPASTTSLVTLTHTSGTANITSNGKSFAALTINGAGGTTQLLDALLVNAVQNSVLTVTNGIFDANGGAGGPFAVTAIEVVSTAANTRSLILGGTVKIGGNISTGQTAWNISTAGTFTFTKNSANIEVLTPTGSIDGIGFSGGGFVYNDLISDTSSNNTVLNISGSNTFANLTIAAGWNLQLASGTTQTITNAPSFTGTKANPFLIESNSVAVATISVASGAVTMAWGGLQGITATGGATFTATNTFNFGTNSGWSISPPADATTVAPTAAAIATAVWQDAVAGDFTVASSIGKDLKTGAVPGAANGHFISGTNAATTITTALTTTFTGNLTGSVGSVTGAVGSVTGNVGGNVTGSVGSVVGAVGSVTGAVGSVTGNVGGNVVGSVASVTGAVGSVTGNVGGNVVGTVASVVGAVGSVTGNVGGNVVGTVASVVGAVGSVTGNVGGNVTGSVGSVVAAVATTSNIKKNQALADFSFIMTDSTNHKPATGLTVTATRSLDGGAFAACANAVVEVANGDYTINLAASDLNANTIMIELAAVGADTLFVEIVTVP